HLEVVGEPAAVLVERRALAGAGAVGEFHLQQLAEEGGDVRGRDPAEVVLQPRGGAAGGRRAVPGLPGGLEPGAHRLAPAGEGGGQRAVPRLRDVAHALSLSWPHSPRISRSLRLTVRGTQPSRSAISSLVYPSILQRATARSSGSPSFASRRWHS